MYFPLMTTFSGGNNLMYMGATAGTNNFAQFGSTVADLTAWDAATATTNNSDVNPSIVAGSYIPLAGTADDLGLPLLLVPTDIDGNTRNVSTPDIGAVEFIGLPGDISLTNTWISEESNCYGPMDTAYATIKNEFGSIVDFSSDNLVVNWTISGPVNSTGTTTLNSGMLNIGEDTSFFVTSVDMTQPGTYTVSAYISTNAVNASTTNDTLVNHSTFDKKAMISVNPKSDTVVLLASDSVKISTSSPFYPAGKFIITEICQYGNQFNIDGTPAGGKPSFWSNMDDYIEITGVPGSDLEGVTLESWRTGGTPEASYTFPAGTILNSQGVAIINTVNTYSSPANFVYASYSLGRTSGDASGRILKDANGNIMDAVGYDGSSTTTAYSFPAAAGVSPLDWDGGYVGATNNSWGIRLEGPDVNGATGWTNTKSPSTALQTPGDINVNVPTPAPTSVAGLQWTDITNSVALDTTPEVYAKGWATPGLYQYEATYNTPCGVYSDTADIFVLFQTWDTAAPTTVCDSFVTPLGGHVVKNSGFPTDTIFGTSPVYDSIIVYYPLTVNVSTSESITVAICDSFVAPSGIAFDSTGIYMDTIPNASGCDSVITIDLTITTTTFIRDTVFACDSLHWRGMKLTTAGRYIDTVVGASCDSIYILNLSMGYATYITNTEFVCDSLVSPSGKVWKMDGTYMDTITNASGCDSVMTFNLTFGYISYSTNSVTVCDSYTSPSGKVWTTSGMYLDTIVNASGCDSAMTFNVTVNY